MILKEAIDLVIETFVHHNTCQCWQCVALRVVIRHAKKVPEFCICAAVKARSGKIIRGHRHADCIRTIVDSGDYIEMPSQPAQGFITSHNRFVSRQEGRQLQDAAGIPSADPGGYSNRNTLFSEDLY